MSEATDAVVRARVVARAESFFDSVVLFALHEGGVYRALADGPLDFAQLEERLDADPASLRSLLCAGVVLKLLASDDGAFSAPDEFLACLSDETSKNYVGGWLSFLRGVAGGLTLSSPSLASRRSPAHFADVVAASNSTAELMTRGVGEYARSRAEELAESIPLDNPQLVVDLGCGEGHILAAVLRRYPRCKGIAVDRPDVLDRARECLETATVLERVRLVAEDLESFEPSQVVDAIVLANVVHMMAPLQVGELLRRVRRFLKPGGAVIIAGQMLDEDRLGPRWPVLANVLMVAATEQGQNHSKKDAKDWLVAAGFENVKPLGLPPWSSTSAVVGHRPAMDEPQR